VPSLVTFLLGHKLVQFIRELLSPCNARDPGWSHPPITFFRFDRAISSFPSGKICPPQY
jgi:hypothetical protein